MQEGLEIVHVVDVDLVAPLIKPIKNLPLIGAAEIRGLPTEREAIDLPVAKIFEHSSGCLGRRQDERRKEVHRALYRRCWMRRCKAPEPHLSQILDVAVEPEIMFIEAVMAH